MANMARLARLADARTLLADLRAAGFRVEAEAVTHTVTFKVTDGTVPEGTGGGGQKITVRRTLFLRHLLHVKPRKSLSLAQVAEVVRLKKELLELVTDDVRCLDCGANAPHPGQGCCRFCEPDAAVLAREVQKKWDNHRLWVSCSPLYRAQEEAKQGAKS